MRAVGLGPRDLALERLASSRSDPLDVLVVGGGITGAGIALDAAARGMRAGLVERYDFASGTSSKSSKLVHGGLRYLEQREFGLMREASAERDLLRNLAPHLVEPIPFILPVGNRWARAKFGAGLWAYDALATFRNLHVHRHLDREQTEAMIPALPRNKIKGGYLFYDCRNDDVRLVMEVLLQATRYGAIVVNYAVVRGLSGSDEVCAAQVEDTVTSDVFEIHARRIVVAAGVWTDEVEALASPDAERRLRPSKGVHLVFRKDKVPMDETAAFIPDAERKRMLFVIPWIDSVIVGTTDTHYSGSLDRPTVEKVDRDYCLDALNASFGLDLKPEDIAGAYAGLRPLVAGKGDSTADLSRRHVLYDIAPGIIGITGGKLTTFRRMARDAVDRVAEEIAPEAKCKTRWVRLGTSDPAVLTLAVERRAQRLGIPHESAANLVRCYGDRSLSVLDVAETRDLAAPLLTGCLPIAAEASYCVRAEMVTHLSDFLARRTRLSLTDPAAGLGDEDAAPRAVGAEIGWSSEERVHQIEAHRIEVERERGMPLRGAAPAVPDAEPARATGTR